MTVFVMAAAVPDGTQMVAVEAETRREAMIFGEKEIRKINNLPRSYAILGRVLEEFSSYEPAQKFMDELLEKIEKAKTERLEKEKQSNAQA